jgi:fucose 4-O-acetylase-like acetyltransferase
MDTKSTHYNVMKFVATILVVVAHSSRMYTGEGVVTPLNPSSALAYLTRLVYSFHMPLFMAISGMVYGFCVDDLGKYRNVPRFVGNKVLRLLVPYLFFGLLYVAPIMVALGFADSSYAEYCLNGILLCKNSRHLWYLVVLFEVFLGCAVGGKVIRKPGLAPVLAVTGLLACASFAAHKLPDIFQLSGLAYYAMFFYLGFALNRFYVPIVSLVRKPVFVLAASALLVAFADTSCWSAKVAKAVLGSLAVIGMTAYMPQRVMEIPAVASAAKNGFGIYLFHPMIVYGLYFFLGPEAIPPIALCVGVALAAYGLSWFLAAASRRLRLSFLLGE